MSRAVKQQLYEANRPYYGYSLKEWSGLDLNTKSIVEHKKCTTCHRVKRTDNFISEYSGKMIKICNFCQNRHFHIYRIDGGASCSKHGGICDTAFIVATGNHCETNFRDLDLSEFVNTDPITILRKQEIRELNRKKRNQKVTCECGAVVCRGSLYKHMRSKKCEDGLKALTESTKCSDNGSVNNEN